MDSGRVDVAWHGALHLALRDVYFRLTVVCIQWLVVSPRVVAWRGFLGVQLLFGMVGVQVFSLLCCMWSGYGWRLNALMCRFFYAMILGSQCSFGLSPRITAAAVCAHAAVFDLSARLRQHFPAAVLPALCGRRPSAVFVSAVFVGCLRLSTCDGVS